MSRATSSGRERKGTWLAGSSTVVACARRAYRRCSSGLIERSWAATRYQLGRSRHAAASSVAWNAEPWMGFCVAAMTRVSASGTSAANTSRSLARSSETNPPASVTSASAMGAGCSPQSPPTVSPASGANAAT